MSNFQNNLASKISYSLSILVFKTNICSREDIAAVAPLLNSSDVVLKWNVDLHDIDNVLRVEAFTTDADIIINTVKQGGYECEELPD